MLRFVIAARRAKMSTEPAGNGFVPASVVISVLVSLFPTVPVASADDHASISRATISVATFGAKGDGLTDDTAPIESAINASLATREHPCVIFPAGIYKVTATIQISDRGVCLQGETPWSTFIDSAISTAIFNLGTFSPMQSPPWSGTADTLTIGNLTLENSAQTSVNFTGLRMTTGIQANGSGHIVMDNVQFLGLKYGFAAPYGSDFDRFRNLWLRENDVGLYMGPCSQQFSMIAIEGDLNGEAVVFDGSGQGALSDSTFEDNMTADLTFEREQPTRFGWDPVSISAYDAQSDIVVSHNWFETGSGNSGIADWQEYRRVLFQASPGLTSYPRNVQIRDSFLVLGNRGIAPKDSRIHSFVELNSGKFIKVDNVEVVGDRRDCAIYGDGAASVAATNILVDDGYNSSIPVFLFAAGTYLSNNFSYTPPFQDAGVTEAMPTSCFSGSQFWYDTTLNNWLGCIKGTYSYFAQLDSTRHIPSSINTLNPFWNSAVVNGDQTSTNAIHLGIYAGNSSSNNGKWWFQNGGNPVDHVNLAGYDASGKANIVLNPSAGLGSGGALGVVLAGFFRSSGTPFANLATPSPGTQIWCTDCQVATPCVGGGAGAFAFRTAAGTWNCPF